MPRLILVIILIIALGFILQDIRRRRSLKGKKVNLGDSGFIPADAIGPSETGRFRVQELLRKRRKFKCPEGTEDKTTEDEEALPDPFSEETEP